MSVDFQDTAPPRPARGPRGDIPHADIVARLKAKPRTWAKIDLPDDMDTKSRRRFASNINKAVIVHYRPAGAFKAVTRTIDGATSLWIQYVGDSP